MKKYSILRLGAAALFAGCCFNMSACAYGPPDTQDIPDQSQTFSPADNQNTEVYGPPEYFDSEADVEIPETDEASSEVSEAYAGEEYEQD